jgi:uncharacterized membrane protein YgcG
VGVKAKERITESYYFGQPGDRKVYIATGYGMKELKPDAYANRIVDQVIIPVLKEINITS